MSFRLTLQEFTKLVMLAGEQLGVDPLTYSGLYEIAKDKHVDGTWTITDQAAVKAQLDQIEAQEKQLAIDSLRAQADQLEQELNS